MKGRMGGQSVDLTMLGLIWTGTSITPSFSDKKTKQICLIHVVNGSKIAARRAEWTVRRMEWTLRRTDWTVKRMDRTDCAVRRTDCAVRRTDCAVRRTDWAGGRTGWVG